MTVKKILLFSLLTLFFACKPKAPTPPAVVSEVLARPVVSDFWKNATVYFLLTDRFANGDPGNDLSLGRQQDGAVLRSFEGGDLRGIIQKIEEGYFSQLGVDALWMTPVVEQIHGSTDEGTGKTYGYHGYWAKDWTTIDPNYGTEADFAAMVEAAHAKGIRVLMDVVINHTGPVTDIDPQWPDSWIRTEPTCTYKSLETTVACTLVENLPDIRTESNAEVELPPFLLDKWKKEGRLETEVASLDAFFQRTGYPRSPRHHIIKWFTDWVKKYGIDGFRIDTAKHTEADIWVELKQEASAAFTAWKKANSAKTLDNEDFYMVGEVYGFGVGGDERAYTYDGGQSVDFFANGFESLINFSFKSDAQKDYESIFSKYYTALNKGPLDGVSILNYIASHDDSSPFDQEREKSMEAATKLMLSPGGVQIYYGDESARSLIIKGTNGDATLRSFMNWEEIAADAKTQKILEHWQKLGQFRRAHPSVGAGIHEQLQRAPYLFRRTLKHTDQTIKDQVLIGLDLPVGLKEISVSAVFADGQNVKDAYSGKTGKVLNGVLKLDTEYGILLLEKA